MSATAPRVGFVSLGCPKALVDSERILTQLKVEGYELVNTYDDADVVVVNTCGFIDAAVEESLDAIGEAMAENGKVIVTGCLGKKPEQIREAHPGVLSISGQSLLDLDADDLSDPRSLLESKLMMRTLITYYLAGKELETRKIFKELQEL